jgi:hypothetical protein
MIFVGLVQWSMTDLYDGRQSMMLEVSEAINSNMHIGIYEYKAGTKPRRSNNKQTSRF